MTNSSKRELLTVWTLAGCLLAFIAVNITMVALGITAQSVCKGEPKLAIYMIGTGASNVTVILLCAIALRCADELAQCDSVKLMLIAKLTGSLTAFVNLIWLIYGTTFKDPGESDCKHSVFILAYVLTILGFVIGWGVIFQLQKVSEIVEVQKYRKEFNRRQCEKKLAEERINLGFQSKILK